MRAPQIYVLRCIWKKHLHSVFILPIREWDGAVLRNFAHERQRPPVAMQIPRELTDCNYSIFLNRSEFLEKTPWNQINCSHDRNKSHNKSGSVQI